MLQSLANSKEDAIAILKSDHDKVKDLFKQFESTDNMREKKKIAQEAIMELKIHAEIEEKIFYPAVRNEINDDDIMNEADEEHHVAKLLIAELDQMDGSEEHWEAKFTVLSENIRHHIKEEEGQMMPKARREDIDFKALGQELLEAKQDLMENGVPQSAEGKLMARGGVKADSPAKAASGKANLKLASHKPGKPTMHKASARSHSSHSKRRNG